MIQGKYVDYYIGDSTISSHIDAVHAASPASDQFTGPIVTKIINATGVSGIIATISREQMDINRPRNKTNSPAIDEYRAVIKNILDSKKLLDAKDKLQKNYLHLAIHGMHNEHNAEFVVGTRHGDSCSQHVQEWFMAELNKVSKNILLNEIFPGDSSKSVHRNGDGIDYLGYGDKFHTIQIEINRTWREKRQSNLVDFFSRTLINFDKMFNQKIQVDYEITGFPNDIAYTAYLPAIIEEFEIRLIGVVKLHCVIKELSYHQLTIPQNEKFAYDKENKTLEIFMPVRRNYDRSGKVTSIPTPFDFFNDLKATLNRAVKEYQTSLKNDG